MSDYQSATSPAEVGARDVIAEPDAPADRTDEDRTDEDRTDEDRTDIASAARLLGADDAEAAEFADAESASIFEPATPGQPESAEEPEAASEPAPQGDSFFANGSAAHSTDERSAEDESKHRWFNR